MGENGKPEAGGAGEESRTEASSAAEVVRALEKAARGLHLYLPNNPLRQRFLEQCYVTLRNHLAGYGALKLDIQEYRILCGGTALYENRDPKESFAFRLHADAVRSLLFREGIAEAEVRSFCALIAKARPDESDDDIATRLWAGDFPHIAYTLIEEPARVSARGLGVRPDRHEERREGLQRARQEAQPLLTGAAPPAQVPEGIFSLSPEELKYLDEIRRQQKERSPIEDVVTILRAILSSEEDRDLFDEFVDLLAGLVRDLFRDKDVDSALALAGVISELTKDGSIDGSRREKLIAARAGILTAEVTASLPRLFDEQGPAGWPQLRSLIGHFVRGDVRPFITILAGLRGEELRALLIEELAASRREEPEVFFPFLQDENGALARETIPILRKINTPKAIGPLSRLTSHPHRKVRKEALLALEELPPEQAGKAILRFLEDEEGSIRARAAGILARSGFAAALDPIRRLVEAEGFDDRVLGERLAFCEALGALGGETTIPVFRRMLLRKHRFHTYSEREATLCAVAGLRRTMSAAAVRLLEEVGASRKDEAGDIIRRALPSLARSVRDGSGRGGQAVEKGEADA